MFKFNHPPGRTALIDGREYLFFSGYSYLGVSHVPEFLVLVKEGIDRYGVLHPSSRISNTRLGIFEEMEAMLSHLTSQEETVMHSSGFLAGKALTEWLAGRSKKLLIAPQTHPALQLHDARLLADDWQQNLPAIIDENDEAVVLMDSLNPLTATIIDFSFLTNLPSNKKITCVIDDSHGIGLLGTNGEGISASLPKLPNVEYVLIYSLSKAFHINGGAISCSKKIADSLKRSPFYTASTSVAPSFAYAFMQAQNIYYNQRLKLLENIKQMQLEIYENDQVQMLPQLPMLILKKEYDQDYFLPHNIIISSFSYPDPSGDKINRVVLNALHTSKDIKRLSTTLM